MPTDQQAESNCCEGNEALLIIKIKAKSTQD
jgi:hypothetical protein